MKCMEKRSLGEIKKICGDGMMRSRIKKVCENWLRNEITNQFFSKPIL